MNTQRQELSGKLMDLDRQDAPARQQYERDLQTLFDRRLTHGDWARLLLMLGGGIGGTIVCGLLAVSEPDAPPRTRVALAVLALIGLSWVGLAGVLIRRRAIDSSRHGAAAATMGFTFALLMTAAVGVLSLSTHRPAPPGLLLLPLAALALAAVVLIVHHVGQAELRLRRDLLGIEYRLAQQTERDAATET